MRLVKTHDGLVGWMSNNKIEWCNNISQLKIKGLLYWEFDRHEYEMFCKEVDYALKHMAQTGDTVAEFGTMGSFMYSHNDDYNDYNNEF